MRCLIDTNVVIALDPASSDLEAGAAMAAALMGELHRHRHQVFVHPAVQADLGRDRDPARGAARRTLAAKYVVLEAPPPLSVLDPGLVRDASSHDQADLAMLAAVVGNAVDIFITDDAGIHRRARRANVADRVLTVVDALSFLRTIASQDIPPPPFVEDVPLYSVPDQDPIWIGLRDDYPGFDLWLSRTKRAGRRALVVRSLKNSFAAAICILKDADDQFELGGWVVKLCTFKVSDDFRGYRFGELLLKAAFGYCTRRGANKAWVTVYPKHAELVDLFEDFGFELARALEGGELLYVKTFAETSTIACQDTQGSHCLDWHVRFGPPALHVRTGHVFLVPVRPEYHRRLFPDAELAPTLPLEFDPIANALRMAYLSNASTRTVTQGAGLLFYRSQESQGCTPSE